MTKHNTNLNYISAVLYLFGFFSLFSRDSIHILTYHFKFLYCLFVCMFDCFFLSFFLCLLQIADNCTGEGLSVPGFDTMLLVI